LATYKVSFPDISQTTGRSGISTINFVFIHVVLSLMLSFATTLNTAQENQST